MLNMLLNEPCFFFSSHYWFLKINFVSFCQQISHPTTVHVFVVISLSEQGISIKLWVPFSVELLSLFPWLLWEWQWESFIQIGRKETDYRLKYLFLRKTKCFLSFLGGCSNGTKKKERQKPKEASHWKEERKTFFLGQVECKKQVLKSTIITFRKKKNGELEGGKGRKKLKRGGVGKTQSL